MEDLIVISIIPEVELTAALYRRVADGGPDPALVEDGLENFSQDRRERGVRIRACEGNVIAEANALVGVAFTHERQIMIRSADAIHVATAALYGASTIITIDKRLAQLARVLGLTVLPAPAE
jgi:predicted nucleic acid-binding protein